jgi:hypothetical protein
MTLDLENGKTAFDLSLDTCKQQNKKNENKLSLE